MKNDFGVVDEGLPLQHTLCYDFEDQ